MLIRNHVSLTSPYFTFRSWYWVFCDSRKCRQLFHELCQYFVYGLAVRTVRLSMRQKTNCWVQHYSTQLSRIRRWFICRDRSNGYVLHLILAVPEDIPKSLKSQHERFLNKCIFTMTVVWQALTPQVLSYLSINIGLFGHCYHNFQWIELIFCPFQLKLSNFFCSCFHLWLLVASLATFMATKLTASMQIIASMPCGISIS